LTATPGKLVALSSGDKRAITPSGSTEARLQTVAVVTAIGAVVGVIISWLLSQILKTPSEG
jgi:hypothetical protein